MQKATPLQLAAENMERSGIKSQRVGVKGIEEVEETRSMITVVTDKTRANFISLYITSNIDASLSTPFIDTHFMTTCGNAKICKPKNIFSVTKYLLPPSIEHMLLMLLLSIIADGSRLCLMNL
ncbi:hypothetical protein MTR_5g018760 [Medicago truncatula]|uniref:Uncharacterized protein n=1 Tax=Medicago truncatula TaxID=3880 RepID=G7KAR1_MEDTR|nr:hypothetical protein MTR_5g018760 [Medicago truncatula]